MERQLTNGLQALGLALDDRQRKRLLAYVALLAKWNKAYNLTAVREPAAMVTRHLLDSLAVVPHLGGGRVLDVGTGAGLPGIPLAIALPDRQFVLLDSNGKKARFVTQVAAELGLANVTVVNCRVEQFHPEQPFDVVISRAFASLADMWESASPLLAPDGVVLAMKGRVHGAELESLPRQAQVAEVIPLAVPGLEDEERHLICLVAASGRARLN